MDLRSVCINPRVMLKILCIIDTMLVSKYKVIDKIKNEFHLQVEGNSDRIKLPFAMFNK